MSKYLIKLDDYFMNVRRPLYSNKPAIRCTKEIDHATWHDLEEAKQLIVHSGLCGCFKVLTPIRLTYSLKKRIASIMARKSCETATSPEKSAHQATQSLYQGLDISADLLSSERKSRPFLVIDDINPAMGVPSGPIATSPVINPESMSSLIAGKSELGKSIYGIWREELFIRISVYFMMIAVLMSLITFVFIFMRLW